MKKYLFYIFAILVTCPVMGMSISGTVVDEQRPLPGASITIVGVSGVGTTTDLDGNFSFENTNITSQSKIQISYIGYETQNLPAKTDMGKIQLNEDDTQLDEVVVSGKYQSRDCNDAELQEVNAIKGKTKINGTSGIICVPSKCITGYELKGESCVKLTCDEPRQILNADGTKCVDNTSDCKSDDTHAVKAQYKYNNSTKQLDCIIKSCQEHYVPSNDGTACEQSSGPCPDAQVKAIAHATAGELNAKRECVPTECETGYEPNSKTRTCDQEQPKLSPEDQANKVAELQENYNNMKAKEQSAASRAAGTIGIGATGIGGMELASALAEQNADAASERDMAAYLATFVCDYGQGRFIKGGETDMELPGANVLLPLRQEYVALATRLKTQKEALNLLPGIESEEIMDKATMGLYDNESLGKTDGAYTSLYRALTDETSADAAEWADQKSKTKTKLNTGIGLVGAGIVGSAAINLIGNKNAPKERSAKINADYAKKLQSIVAEISDKAEQLQPSESCETFGASGTYPDCTCNDTNKIFDIEGGDVRCVSCAGDLVVIDGACGCPNGTVPNGDKCVTPDNNCKLTGLVDNPTSATCKCVNNAHEDAGVCVCDDGYNEDENNVCIAQTPIVPEQGVTIAEFSLDTDATFASGSATINSDKALELIKDFNTKLTNAKTQFVQQGGEIENLEYCVTITGHTDRQQFRSRNKTNQKLSEDRAAAIKEILIQGTDTQSDNIRTYGAGEDGCPTEKGVANPDCRRVDVSLTAGACGA